MELSIVIPVYNEVESIPRLLEEIHEALGDQDLRYEVICVDDGSTDGSFALLQKAAETDPTLVVASFRRNFGQTAAMQAGFDAAHGEVVVTLDADLQNDPKDIPGMLAKLDEGYDMVAGWQSGRKDRFLNRRLPSVIANWIISRTTNVRLHDYGCTIKAMRRSLVKELKLYGEMHRFIPAIASFVGARIHEMEVAHRARQFGKSKYGIGRTARVILDLLTVLFLKMYLVRPMQVFGWWGMVSFSAGVGITGYLTFEKLAHGVALADRPLLLAGVMLVLVGVQLLSLGLVADVLGRTYHEAQGKPPYYIREWVLPEGEEAPAAEGANTPRGPAKD